MLPNDVNIIFFPINNLEIFIGCRYVLGFFSTLYSTLRKVHPYPYIRSFFGVLRSLVQCTPYQLLTAQLSDSQQIT